MRRAAGLLLIALGAVAGGCATAAGPMRSLDAGPVVYRRGEVEPGQFLVTVIVGRDACRAETGSCTTSDRGTVRVLLSRSPEAEDWVYEAYAHELCHVIAGLRGLVGPLDPCHREDGGRMHAVRGPFRSVATRPR